MADEPATPRTDLPPLRIHHLLAWTAVTGIMLAGQQGNSFQNAQMPFELPEWWRHAVLGVSALGAMMSAAAVTVVLFGLYWRRHGVRFFYQPGHWLLVATAVLACASFIVMPIAQLASGDQPWVVLVTSLALLVFAVGLNIYIARKQCTTARWRYVFIAKAVASLIAFVGQLVTVIVLLRAMRGDRREELSRDWAHWSGVILELGTTAMMFMWVVIFIGLMVSRF